jgi:hypothetical protein
MNSADLHQGADKVTALEYRTSTRRNFGVWMLLLVGIVFAYGGYTIDPESNCSEDGECAPWLVPIAFVMGIGATMAAVANLIVNGRSGSYVDVSAGELVWWEGRVGDGRAQAEGRLPLARIARARIVDGGDSEDELFLYGHDGQLLPFGSNAVVRWPYGDWAQQLAAYCPGLVIDDKPKWGERGPLPHDNA